MAPKVSLSKTPLRIFLPIPTRGVHPSILLTAAFLAIGFCMILQPDRFDNTPSYGLLLDVLPAWAWGIYYLVAGALLLGALIPTVNVKLRWVAVVTAHTVAGALLLGWLLAFVIRYFTDSGTTIVNVVWWSVALTLVVRSALMAVDRVISREVVRLQTVKEEGENG